MKRDQESASESAFVTGVVFGIGIGGVAGAYYGFVADAALGVFILYVIGGLVVGCLGGTFIGWGLSTLSNMFAYISNNPKELILIVGIVAIVAGIWFFRDLKFH